MRVMPLATAGKSTDLIGAVGSVITVLVVFLVVLYLAYMASKLIGKRYGGGGTKNLQVLETQSLGPNRQLMLVRAADKILLLGAGKEGITLLCELDEASLRQPDAAPETPLDFASALKQAAAARFGKQPAEKKTEQSGGNKTDA